MAESRPIFGYWDIRAGYRGNANRYLLNFAGVDYECKRYDAKNKDIWRNEKDNLGMDFPNLPYIWDGDFKLSESKAVSIYICDRWCPQLMGKNAEERAHIIMLQCLLEECFFAFCLPGFRSPDKEAAFNGGMEKLVKIAEWLGNKQFLIGAKPTMVDFYFFEIIETLNAISGSNGVYTAQP